MSDAEPHGRPNNAALPHYTLRGLTQREIVKALDHSGVINPKTGNPYNLSQINRDLKAIRAEWRAERLESIDEHIAVMLAEIREVRRRAWANQDLDTVLKCTKQERDLLGLDQPQKQQLTGDVVIRVEYDDDILGQDS